MKNPMIEISVLSEVQAKELCKWEYKGQYSVYNFSDWPIVVKNNWAISIREKREKEYVAIMLDNVFVACGRINIANGDVFLGIGLKPSLCGNGLGASLMLKLVEAAKLKYPNKKIMVEVRDFNRRAKKCYESIGFVVIDHYWKDKKSGGDNFYLMDYQIRQ